ncbi:hypothetical protein HDU86_004890 [Geranomyces michiganensis]|nr:hypothetical protein HDU86_004890 [Geranomyces michiganensis]
MPSPRRPTAEIYSPPHRHHAASQGGGAAKIEDAAPTVGEASTIIHAWDMPQPKSPSPSSSSPAAVTRIVHAWETNDAGSRSSGPTPDRKGRSQERSRGRGRGRGASRSPRFDPDHQRHRDDQSPKQGGVAAQRPQSPEIRVRMGRKSGRGGGGSASVPISRAVSRTRSTSRRPNRQHRREFLLPEEAAAASDAPRLIQPWDVLAPNHSEERSNSHSNHRADGSSIWARLGPREVSPPPPPAADGRKMPGSVKPSLLTKSSKTARNAGDIRATSASPAADPRGRMLTDAPVAAPPKISAPPVMIDLQKLRDTAKTNWADDDDDDDWQRELLMP